MPATAVPQTVINPVSVENYSQLVLKRSIFEEISRIVYKNCGIRLVKGKEELVRSRLLKRLRILGIPNFDSYMKFVNDKKNKHELKLMIESLTTNKTSFFRESPHFDYLKSKVLPELTEHDRGIRIWSAGCSSGEEPYSIAILLHEELPFLKWADMRILATDISTQILEKARKGEYEKELLQGIPPQLVNKYFNQTSTFPFPRYQIKEYIKKIIRFANLNLMATWPMKGLFDVIFCRNVMIYFDHSTQKDLVHRFYEMLVPGGYLMVGHSESLIASHCEFKYVQPATYRKQ